MQVVFSIVNDPRIRNKCEKENPPFGGCRKWNFRDTMGEVSFLTSSRSPTLNDSGGRPSLDP